MKEEIEVCDFILDMINDYEKFSLSQKAFWKSTKTSFSQEEVRQIIDVNVLNALSAIKTNIDNLKEQINNQ